MFLKDALQDKRAFTLIEVMAVSAMVAILAAMILVSLGNTFTKAKDAQTLANSKELDAGINAYYAEHGGVYPQIPGSEASNNFDSAEIDPNFIRSLVNAGDLHAGIAPHEEFWYGGYEYLWRDHNPTCYNQCEKAGGWPVCFNACTFESVCGAHSPSFTAPTNAQAVLEFATSNPVPTGQLGNAVLQDSNPARSTYWYAICYY